MAALTLQRAAIVLSLGKALDHLFKGLTDEHHSNFNHSPKRLRQQWLHQLWR